MKKRLLWICGAVLLVILSTGIVFWVSSRPFIPDYVSQIKGSDIDKIENNIIYSKYFGFGEKISLPPLVEASTKGVQYGDPKIAVNPFNKGMVVLRYCIRNSRAFAVEPLCGRNGVAVYYVKSNYLKEIFAKDVEDPYERIRIGWDKNNLYIKEGKIDLEIYSAELNNTVVPKTPSLSTDVLYAYPLDKII